MNPLVYVVLGVLAGAGVGVAGGFWWGVGQLARAEVRLERERASKDRLLERLGDVTASAIRPVQEAVTETVRATVAAVVAPMGSRVQSASVPQVGEPVGPGEHWPQWLKDRYAAKLLVEDLVVEEETLS